MKKNKCNVVMLAAEKNNSIGNIVQRPSDKRLAIINVLTTEDKQECINQHFYITSSDEIKENDWFYNYSNQEIVKNLFKKLPIEFGKVNKIIATTDSTLYKDEVAKIGLPFIEEYITEYNKGNILDTVLVEYEQSKIYIEPQNYQQYISKPKKLQFPSTTNINDIWSPKLNSNSTIIIHKVQEMFTKEDMEKAYISGFYHGVKPEIDCNFETWFKQNY